MREEKDSWRDRALNRVTRLDLFILRILHGDADCLHVVHFGRWNSAESADRAVRERLPLAVIRRLAARIAERISLR